ncbi:MAG TPA: ATP cone domain-containing protein [Gemmataceae bacterium]|nr:ATP cone domain-containing protein [Gemmataceae bacterium]
MTESRGLPNWIVRPDGEQEPFDAEKVFRAMFRAAGRLGAADAFRARELSDAVLHFLAESGPGDAVGLDDFIDTVVKVVRELGHPSLARTRAESTDLRAADGGTVTDLFPAEILAAERAGLLALGDREHSTVLAGSVVVPQLPRGGNPSGMLQRLCEARGHTGGYVAIDGPEYLLPVTSGAAIVSDWVAELREGLRRTGLRAVVNLNCRTPPPWAVAPSGGLFPSDSPAEIALKRALVSRSLFDEISAGETGSIRIDWHICESDFEAGHRPQILHVCRRLPEGVPMTFVPDRPRRPVALAEGLDRNHPAVFSVVGMRIDGLARYLAPTTTGQPGALLRAIPSLGSLARSAGHARLQYLRSHGGPGIDREFLLDRGRLLVVPLGLPSVARMELAHMAEEGDVQQQLLRAVLGGMSRFSSLGPPTVLDSAPPGSGLPSPEKATELAANVTPESQLRHAAALQGDTQTGTASIVLPTRFSTNAEDLAGLIEYAYRLPGLVRCRFVPPGPDSPTLAVV